MSGEGQTTARRSKRRLTTSSNQIEKDAALTSKKGRGVVGTHHFDESITAHRKQ